MPKVASEKTSERKSGWGGGGQLFGSENGENTFQGAGFKDKEKALETIRLLEGRDPSYQLQIVNSMYNRAKVIYKRTTDKEKRTNLNEAIETFEEWISDYKAKGRSKEGFAYLPLETVEAFKPLADHMKIDDCGFLKAYSQAEGDIKKLRITKPEGEEKTWDVVRNRNLKEISTKVKEEFIGPFETDDTPLRGMPTAEYLSMIMWGYHSEPTRIKKLIPQIDEIVKS